MTVQIQSAEDNIIQIAKHRCKNSPWHVGPFLIVEDGGYVECGACTAHITPMATLKFLSGYESRLAYKIRDQVDKLKRVEEKKSCKCEHCGKMTKIDRSLS